MPISGYQVPEEGNRLLEKIRAMEDQIRDLQQKTPHIPTLAADPDPADPTNLWFLDDGRLRARTRDGTIREYAFSVHLHDERYVQIGSPGTGSQGGGTSTAPPPEAAYVPSSKQYRSGPDWATSYRLGGSVARTPQDDFLYYGRYSATNQEQMSMVHFPGVKDALAPTLAGPARIGAVRARIINQHTYGNAGTELRLGLHNSSGSPVAFTESEWPPFAVKVYKAGYAGGVDQTYDLPTWVGERFRDNAAQGITLNQHSTALSYYGYATRNIELIIDYVS